MKTSLIHPDYISMVWGEVAPLMELAVATSHGRYTLNDVLVQLARNDQSLWVAFDPADPDRPGRIFGTVTTKIMDYPQCKKLALVYCAGTRFKDWKEPMLAMLEKWGRDHGCTGYEMNGRRGWARVLADEGFVQRQVCYEKEFDNG